MKKHVSKSPTLVRVNAAALRALRAQGEEWCVSDLWLPGAPAMVHLEALNSLIIAYWGLGLGQAQGRRLELSLRGTCTRGDRSR
jgi:hypothetical protein